MNRARILIVDDDPDICELMMECLGEKNYAVTAATNGVDGLRICAEQEIDLIVLDLNMPRMDGYMFMERLNNRSEEHKRKFKKPKILVMSAVDRKSDLGLTDNLGADLFMSKPFKRADFSAAVKNLLEG